jgi:hypothetical protein
MSNHILLLRRISDIKGQLQIQVQVMETTGHQIMVY